jgi:SAM-dependent methyltransferase
MKAVLAEIKSDIESIEKDAKLREEASFDERADAIDFIEFHIIDRLESLPKSEEALTLKQRAEELKHLLESIDTNLFRQLRENITAGLYTGDSFKEMVQQYTGYGSMEPGIIGYDNLDVFINGLLDDRFVPEAMAEPGPEMVFYQKTPARLVFQLAALAQLKPGDVFYDIGSGLGQVVILLHLISGAACRGVEYEPAYHAYAQACAARLNATPVQFINADARNVDYSDGTVFFLYTPFLGTLLQQVLDILQQQAQKHPIRLFTYGPCSKHVAQQSWLRSVNGFGDDEYVLYEFRG